MRDERIVLGDHELALACPTDPESLIDERRFDEDEFLPYWAELWPSGIALARHVATLDVVGRRVLELGCGLALPSFAAALGSANVTATDWAREAVDLVAVNAAANGLEVTPVELDWSIGAENFGRFDLVLAADVLYEERNAEPLVTLLGDVVAPGGAALVADPGRRHAAAFFDRAQLAGWSLERTAVAELPSGGIIRLSRAPG